MRRILLAIKLKGVVYGTNTATTNCNKNNTSDVCLREGRRRIAVSPEHGHGSARGGGGGGRRPPRLDVGGEVLDDGDGHVVQANGHVQLRRAPSTLTTKRQKKNRLSRKNKTAVFKKHLAYSKTNTSGIP